MWALYSSASLPQVQPTGVSAASVGLPILAHSRLAASRASRNPRIRSPAVLPRLRRCGTLPAVATGMASPIFSVRSRVLISHDAECPRTRSTRYGCSLSQKSWIPSCPSSARLRAVLTTSGLRSSRTEDIFRSFPRQGTGSYHHRTIEVQESGGRRRGLERFGARFTGFFAPNRYTRAQDYKRRGIIILGAGVRGPLPLPKKSTRYPRLGSRRVRPATLREL